MPLLRVEPNDENDLDTAGDGDVDGVSRPNDHNRSWDWEDNDDGDHIRGDGLVRLSSDSFSSPKYDIDNTICRNPNSIKRNFLWFAILFSINHAAGLSCISLAAIQFQQHLHLPKQPVGRTGAGSNDDTGSTTTTSSTIDGGNTHQHWQQQQHVASYQDSMIYISYTVTALLGVPCYVNRTIFQQNSKRAVVLGMYLFTVYVCCFWIAVLLYPDTTDTGSTDTDTATTMAGSTNMAFMARICDGMVYLGAIMGGVGAAIAISNQSIYYTQIVHHYVAATKEQPYQIMRQSTSRLFPDENRDSANREKSVPPLSKSESNSMDVFDHAENDDDCGNGGDNDDDGVVATHTFNVHTTDDSYDEHQHRQKQELQRFASTFAFCLLSIETLWNCATTLCIHYLRWNWHLVFATYTALAFASTILVQLCCTNAVVVPPETKENRESQADKRRHESETNYRTQYFCHDTTLSTLRLFVTDSKIKYMFGYTSAFALSSVYLNIFITGQVVLQSISGDAIGSTTSDVSYNGTDDNHTALNVSMLVTCHGIFAAFSAFGFGYLSSMSSRRPPLQQFYNSTWCCCYGNSNTAITIFGAVCFACIAIPFLFHPVIHDWSFASLAILYALQGVGRATFEGPFKALIADYFPEDHRRDAAFSNVIVQHGLISSLAYGMVDHLSCDISHYTETTNADPSTSISMHDTFCVQYRDGTGHNIWTMSWIMIGSCIVAVLCLARGAFLYGAKTTGLRTLNGRQVSKYHIIELSSQFNSRHKCENYSDPSTLYR